MKMINWYTICLGAMAGMGFIFSIFTIDPSNMNIFLLIIGIVIILEVFPIILPSGDKYAAASIGYIFLMVYVDISNAIIAIVIATISYYLKALLNNKIPLMQLLVTMGMYIISLIVSDLVWNLFNSSSIVGAVLFTTLAFEIINLFLLEGILVFVYKKTGFFNMKLKAKEVLYSSLISTFLLYRLLILESEHQTIMALAYSLFFILVIMLFSNEMSKQLWLRKETVRSTLKILESNMNPRLTGHGNRVGMICAILLEDLKYSPRRREELIHAATIHDIGKSLLSPYILRKKGSLTISEEMEYKKHTEKALDLVKNMLKEEHYGDWILYHPERWDGKGYPKGLKGEEIPLESRIISLANEMDRILLKNSNDKALELLKKLAGKTLDPSLVEKVNLAHLNEIEWKLNYAALREGENDQVNETIDPTHKSEQLNLGEFHFIQVKPTGEILSPIDLPSNYVHELAALALERQELIHEIYAFKDMILDIYAHPLENGGINMFAHDISSSLKYREQMEHKVLESYGEIISSLTKQKIILHPTKGKLWEQLGQEVSTMKIQKNADIPRVRSMITDVLGYMGGNFDVRHIQLAVTEAATNTIKHALDGIVSVHIKEDKLQFLIADNGSGIPLHEIPKSILLAGYSSKRSLGQGFKIIANFSDHIMFYTGSEGTLLILEFYQNMD